MFWLLDKVVHTMFVICCALAKGGVGPKTKRYETYQKKDVIFKFQKNLGIELLNYAIGREWKDFDRPRPQWMRQDEFVSCNVEHVSSV